VISRAGDNGRHKTQFSCIQLRVLIEQLDRALFYPYPEEEYMPISDSKENLAFDPRRLRLIAGALAFALPSTVIALTGRINTSISASYHEVQSRNVFVGFLFIIGAFLISYKGHVQEPDPDEPRTFLRWLKRYEEDWVSTIGGIAAILTALFPTARDGYPMDTAAYIHTAGTFILFASVVYFCLIAFLRSVNEKLVEENPAFMPLKEKVRRVASQPAIHSAKELLYLWLPEIFIFLRIATQVSRDYNVNGPDQDALESDDEPGKSKLKYMWLAYRKKITRGVVYLACGVTIALTLAGFLLIMWRRPDLVRGTNTAFVIETIALVFFGIAWMTASQVEYYQQFKAWRAAIAQQRNMRESLAIPSLAGDTTTDAPPPPPKKSRKD
jgi:hypothetical protein